MCESKKFISSTNLRRREKVIQRLLNVHIDEADKRYKNWKKDNMAVNLVLTTEENIVMEESK